MKKLLIVFFCFCNLFFSCEKESNLINSCPELIQDVNLGYFPMNSYTINEIELNQNKLFIDVNYGGGCEDHIFKLVMEPNFCATPPINYFFYLSHDANNDLCEALISESLCFDISEFLNENFNNEVFLFFSHQDSLYNFN